jgi:hypothetical protein
LVTSNSDITRVIENAKDLITKEKTGEFKPQHQKDQLSVALETKEHRGHTRAISSIASWKELFTEDICMYKKRGRHDIGVESTNNKEQFATQFFNFMRKHLGIIISQMSISQINLHITPSNVGSTPDHQKYLVDDINEIIPCTLLYAKGRILRTIKVVDAIMMATRIMHGRLIPSECVVAEVTTIREGHEFEDLDYPNEEEGTEKLKYAKVNFNLWPHKYIILKTHSALIFSLQNREDEGTPMSHPKFSILECD